MNCRTACSAAGLAWASGVGDLPHLGGQLVEEADLLAQFDRRRLGARERVPLRERRLLVEELAGALLGLEDQVVGVAEQLRRIAASS